MTKEQLIKEVAKKNDLSLVKTEAVLNSVQELITKQIKKDGRFSVPGFGSFNVKSIKKHTIKGIDGSKTVLPKNKRVTFRAYKKLKETVNGSKKK